MASCGTFQKLSPLSLLAHLSSCYDSAHLKVNRGPASWSIYLQEGKITYASHSIAPFDRLDCHLHRLSHKIPALTSETRAQLSLMFETDTENQLIDNPEYQAICWLVNHQYLTTTQASEVIAGLITEVLESFLLVKTGTYEFGKNLDEGQVFCRLDLQPIIINCQKRLQDWQSLAPQIWSPYQRLYFSNRHKIEQQLSPENQQKLSAILKGFSFRHLAVLLNQDEIQLAQSLYQYIVDGTILLQDPYPPFEQLPRTFETAITNQVTSLKVVEIPSLPINNSTERAASYTPKPFNPNRSVQIPPQALEKPPSNLEPEELVRENPAIKFTPSPITIDNERTNNLPVNIPIPPGIKSKYKIVCVDDSPVILQEIENFLQDEIFSVFTISNPVKALMQIIKIKPDMVLLDVNMSGIDGYELCRLLRNHSFFRSTPIIMVTANTGIINRVKARIGGASGYVTKPFTQSDLLKMVFKHLS